MYQVTAIYQDCEVGYGEGEGLPYALEECLDSIDSFYRPILSDLTLRAVHKRFPDGRRSIITMDTGTARAVIGA